MTIAKSRQANGNQVIIARLLEHCHCRHYAAKAAIIRQGDPADELLYIIKGSVAVVQEDDKGHEIVLAYLNAGQFIGEISLFIPNRPRTALVRARTACEIAHITYEKLRNNRAIFPEIVFLIATQLAKRLLQTNRKVDLLAFLDVSGGVWRTLLDLCTEPDAMTHPEGMQIRITRHELARIVGCSREMAGRVLKNLQSQGLITARGKTIVVFGQR